MLIVHPSEAGGSTQMRPLLVDSRKLLRQVTSERYTDRLNLKQMILVALGL